MDIIELLKEFNSKFEFEYDEIEYFCNDEEVIKQYKEKFGLENNNNIVEREKFWKDNEKSIIKERLIFILLNKELRKKKEIDDEIDKILNNENLKKQDSITNIIVKSYKSKLDEIRGEYQKNSQKRNKLLRIAADEVGYFYEPLFSNEIRQI